MQYIHLMAANITGGKVLAKWLKIISTITHEASEHLKTADR